MVTQTKPEIARWAIDHVAPTVRSLGAHHPAGVDGPTHWKLQAHGMMLIFAEHALLATDERSLSCLLDMWPIGKPKVLSVTWEPSRPWEPPRVIRYVDGPWRQALSSLTIAVK